ncbi:hypothetical protein OROGR_018479 [Orobanche gracilis]
MNMDDTESCDFFLPDNILEPLFVASGTSVLNKALECLIETAKTSDGRIDLASKHILLPVLELVRYPSQISVQDLFLSIKLLRNLCAGEIKNQNLFISQNGVELLSTLVSSGSNNGTLSLVLQVLGNVSLAGEQYCGLVWRQFFPHRFLDIAKVRSTEACDPLCMVIYTCSEGSNERSAEMYGDSGQQITVEIIRTATIGKYLVDYKGWLQKLPLQFDLTTEKQLTFRITKIPEGCFSAKIMSGFRQDWGKLLLSRICIEEPYFTSIFSKLPEAVETGNSNEKVFLLSILLEILNEQVGDIVISNDFCLCIFEILKSAVGIVDFGTRGKLPFPTGCTNIDIIGYTLSVLRDISARDRKVSNGDKKDDTVDMLVAAGLIKFLINLLREVEPPALIRRAMMNSGVKNETRLQNYKCCPYRGFRRDIIAVIANCSYGKKNVQDEIREENGIFLLLQHCVNDEENPFLREWGIWLKRTIFSENIENSLLVADLNLRECADCPEISRLGLRVQVDPKTHRLKLVNA